ncbi:MAG: hypothetical protein VW835_06600 [Rickettsiales bacterium]
MTIVAGGALSALLCALAALGSFGGILLAYFCQLPLFVVGLSMGTAAGAIAGAIAGAGVLAMGGVFGVLVFILFNAAPVVFLVRQALLFRSDEAGNTEWYPPGLLAASATCCGLILLTLVFVWLGLTTEGVEASIRDYIGRFAEGMFKDLPLDDRQKVVDGVAPILLGTVGLSWLVMLVINGTLGQGLATRMGWNLRPSPDFTMMVLPRWLPMVAAALLICAVAIPGTLGFFATNAALIAALPFFLVGLAVVHMAAKRISAGPMLLILFYILMLLFGWPVAIVAFLGLIEQMAGFRQRLARTGEEN